MLTNSLKTQSKKCIRVIAQINKLTRNKRGYKQSEAKSKLLGNKNNNKGDLSLERPRKEEKEEDKKNRRYQDSLNKHAQSNLAKFHMKWLQLLVGRKTSILL